LNSPQRRSCPGAPRGSQWANWKVIMIIFQFAG
jgi:hypothetical protein